MRSNSGNQTQTILQEAAEEAEKVHEVVPSLLSLLPPVKIQHSEIVTNMSDLDKY
jgi:hypothetical protein